MGYDYCLLHQVLRMKNVFQTTALSLVLYLPSETSNNSKVVVWFVVQCDKGKHCCQTIQVSLFMCQGQTLAFSYIQHKQAHGLCLFDTV